MHGIAGLLAASQQVQTMLSNGQCHLRAMAILAQNDLSQYMLQVQNKLNTITTRGHSVLFVYLMPIGYCDVRKSQTRCPEQVPWPCHGQSCTALSEH